MTLHAKSKSGRDFRTIFVDEIDGQLSQKIRHEFADMNREALKEGEFGTMFLVSHSNEVIDSADRMIQFDEGAVSII
jgi:ABC-type lipoprotein export system ATPase subunit